jgi:hypothetical protein
VNGTGVGIAPQYLPQIFETFKGWIRHVPMLGIGVFVARRALQWLGHPCRGPLPGGTRVALLPIRAGRPLTPT